jgi:hypothetical protein
MEPTFGTQEKRLFRLKNAFTRKKQVSFLLGIGLTAPIYSTGQPVASSVTEIVSLIRKIFNESGSIHLLDDRLLNAHDNAYQISMQAEVIDAEFP